MIERHWDGIAAYCRPEHEVSVGVVEGLNNKSRVLQRRAYSYRDEEYLKLKINFRVPAPATPKCLPRPTVIRVDPRRPMFPIVLEEEVALL